MGVPAARIMRFITYMLYIVGTRANPGGHTDTTSVIYVACKPHCEPLGRKVEGAAGPEKFIRYLVYPQPSYGRPLERTSLMGTHVKVRPEMVR